LDQANGPHRAFHLFESVSIFPNPKEFVMSLKVVLKFVWPALFVLALMMAVAIGTSGLLGVFGSESSEDYPATLLTPKIGQQVGTLKTPGYPYLEAEVWYIDAEFNSLMAVDLQTLDQTSVILEVNHAFSTTIQVDSMSQSPDGNYIALSVYVAPSETAYEQVWVVERLTGKTTLAAFFPKDGPYIYDIAYGPHGQLAMITGYHMEADFTLSLLTTDTFGKIGPVNGDEIVWGESGLPDVVTHSYLDVERSQQVGDLTIHLNEAFVLLFEKAGVVEAGYNGANEFMVLGE
jgi:hypothetical protein